VNPCHSQQRTEDVVLLLIGYQVVLGTVFGGYMMTGGHLGALYQPAEFVIIGGAGVGAFIVGNNGKAIKATVKALPLLFRGSKYNKSTYMDLMALLYRLMAKSRQQGMFSLERDIENPKESEIFASYPRILADKVMLEFITDYLRLIISGNMNTFEIEALMDEEIETHENECEIPANSLAIMGDSLPAFGIVAAVMGVVHALASADRPAAELGALIAHAMVGTFLGILLAYGFISPLATVLRQKSAETTKMMQCVKVTLLSSLNGYAPPIAVEFGRKTLYSTERPSFIELDEHVRAVKSPNQQTTTEDA
jgi:chemotaxis protein MotA